MSAFAGYISSDSEEDEEYERRAAESNRKAKLEIERLKAKKNLEKKREELKKARLLREEEARARKEKARQEEETALNDALKSLQTKSLSENERKMEEMKLKQNMQTRGRGVFSAAAETEILRNLANAYLGNEDDEEIEEENEEQEVVVEVDVMGEERRGTSEVMTAMFIPASITEDLHNFERSSPEREVLVDGVDIDIGDININFEESTEALEQSLSGRLSSS